MIIVICPLLIEEVPEIWTPFNEEDELVDEVELEVGEPEVDVDEEDDPPLTLVDDELPPLFPFVLLSTHCVLLKT